MLKYSLMIFGRMPFINQMSFASGKRPILLRGFWTLVKSVCAVLVAVSWPEIYLPSLSAQTTPGQGSTYYIATNGNDAWSGTAPAYVGGTTGPWLTFTHINYGGKPGLQPGDVVYVRGGIYNHTGDNLSTAIYLAGVYGTASSPVVVSNYPGETPVIFGSGSNVGTISLTSVSWVKILGINSTNAYRQVYIQKATNCEFAYCNVGGGNTNIGYLQPFAMYGCSQSNWIHNNTVHDALAWPASNSLFGILTQIQATMIAIPAIAGDTPSASFRRSIASHKPQHATLIPMSMGTSENMRYRSA